MIDQLLPDDTLYNIFSKIPIKSLARFRCVCKQWREYIDDPYLANIHHVKELKPMHIALIKSSHPYHQRVSVHSFLCVAGDATDETQLKKDLSSRFLVKRSSIYHYHQYKIQGYCNGLIALVRRQHHLPDNDSTFVVINPLTKECHELPPMRKRYTLGRGQGLGFDNSTNTFKMVCVLDKRVNMVHVLGTDSWREIPPLPFYNVISGEAIYANGRLYWFSVASSSSIGSQVAKLVWLDMKKEEFGATDLPKQREEGWFSDKLVDLNGELGFVYHIEGSYNTVVWILKHDQEWMIHCVIDQSKYSKYYGRRWVVLGCWNKDGDILMSSYTREGIWLYIVYRLKSRSFYSLIGPEDDPAGEEAAEVRMYQSSLHSIRKWH